MALNAGSDVIVDNTEALTSGSGLKLELYNADVAAQTAAGNLPAPPTLGSTAAPYSASRPAAQADIDSTKRARLLLLRDCARRANAYGGAIVAHIVANGKARVASTLGGLQKTPNPNNADTATAAPGADVDLPLV